MIPESVRTKIKKLALLLSSSQPHEALAARDAIDRLLRANGADWHAFGELIAAPAPSAPQAQEPSQSSQYGDRPWQEVAEALLVNADRFQQQGAKVSARHEGLVRDAIKKAARLARLVASAKQSTVDGRVMDRYHQVPTHRVTYLEIVSDSDFQAGMSDFFNGRSLPPFNCHWGYERGRLFASCFHRDRPHASQFDLSRKELVTLAARYFHSGEIL